MNQGERVTDQGAKLVSVWAAIGVTTWAEAASFLAFIYTAVLLFEWAWKRVIRRIAIQRGWVRSRKVDLERVDD